MQSGKKSGPQTKRVPAIRVLAAPSCVSQSVRRLPLYRPACAAFFCLVLVSSISVIYVRHLNRITFVALHQGGQERDRLNVEWGQLLIEESLWSFPHRIEKDAVEVLGMKMPQPDDIRLVEY